MALPEGGWDDDEAKEALRPQAERVALGSDPFENLEEDPDPFPLQLFDQFGDLDRIKANHGTRLVTQFLRGQHHCLQGHADRSLRLVSLEPFAAFMKRTHPSDEKVRYFLRRVLPVPLRFLLPGLHVSSE